MLMMATTPMVSADRSWVTMMADGCARAHERSDEARRRPLSAHSKAPSVGSARQQDAGEAAVIKEEAKDKNIGTAGDSPSNTSEAQAAAVLGRYGHRWSYGHWARRCVKVLIAVTATMVRLRQRRTLLQTVARAQCS